jgi:hypothetical protein
MRRDRPHGVQLYSGPEHFQRQAVDRPVTQRGNSTNILMDDQRTILTRLLRMICQFYLLPCPAPSDTIFSAQALYGYSGRQYAIWGIGRGVFHGSDIAQIGIRGTPAADVGNRIS